MSIATLPMYDWPEVAADVDRLWARSPQHCVTTASIHRRYSTVLAPSTTAGSILISSSGRPVASRSCCDSSPRSPSSAL